MYIPKKYGQSKVSKCPFCEKIGTFKNKQDIPVCSAHKDTNLDDVKCTCGKFLELHSGKWGPYFRCVSCGNVNFNRALEMNPIQKIVRNENGSKNNKEIKAKAFERKEIGKRISPTEIVLTSDELDLM